MISNSIQGKNIHLRLVEISDAEFIIELRLKKGKFLSDTDDNIEKQKEWISQYKEREKNKKEYYFIIGGEGGKRLGTVRVYGIVDNSFCWGSWLVSNEAPKSSAIESAMLLYSFTFNKLKFKKSYFDVRKGNVSVARFHKRFGATVIKEDEENYFFVLTRDSYVISAKKYNKYQI
ncbi:MAG: RimJ/RimL family protein N-acetyltransferase [Ulvibacter sp.]|jgi:RimJ/RimL family protein N-acetyltransferase